MPTRRPIGRLPMLLVQKLTSFVVLAYFFSLSSLHAQGTTLVPIGGFGRDAPNAPECQIIVSGQWLDIFNTFSVTAGAQPSFLHSVFFPEPSDVDWQTGYTQTRETITALKSAVPGTYKWQVVATPQPGCPTNAFPGGGASYTTVEVIPGITGPPSNPNFVWWFNGQGVDTIADYPTSALLTLPGAGVGSIYTYTYQWTVTSGGSLVQFDNGMQTITTTEPSAKVTSIGASTEQNDVTITVTASQGGQVFLSYGPFKMTVLTPYSMTKIKWSCPAFTPAKGQAGYSCITEYATYDQFKHSMRGGHIPSNESFIGPPSPIYPGETWPAANIQPCGGRECDGLQNPADFMDRDGFAAPPGSLVPDPQPAVLPYNSVLVVTFGGAFYLGSIDQTKGSRSDISIWRYYQDHADHQESSGNQ